MSDKAIPTPLSGVLSKESIEAVSGGEGECTPQQWLEFANHLTSAYESLVDFTSHVFERISTAN